MTYQETLDYLFSQLPVYQQIGSVAYKEGLDNSLALDSYFGHPHSKYKMIHVGGTNGKGSTSHTLAAILQKSGYRIGLYTSPHLVDFRERIRVDGEKVSEQYVIDFVENHKAFFEPIHPSFFELTMTMAFQYFAEMKVDIAIVEVGLGGRLDSTNIITPDLSIITNISFDHVQFLGDTLDKIAREKAGIIKPNIPIVIGEAEGDVRQIFEETARTANAPIVFAEDLNLVKAAVPTTDGHMFYQVDEYPGLKGELGGIAQMRNTSTILTALHGLKKLDYKIPDEAVYEGFLKVIELTGLMGRWQYLGDNPRMVCDTGHNVAGMKYIVEQLKNQTYEQLHIVIGMVNDKDVSSILKLLPQDALYYFTRAEIPRSMNEAKLAEIGVSLGLEGQSYPHVKDAINAAQEAANESDFIFIGGSNFVVADALTALDCKS